MIWTLLGRLSKSGVFRFVCVYACGWVNAKQIGFRGVETEQIHFLSSTTAVRNKTQTKNNTHKQAKNKNEHKSYSVADNLFSTIPARDEFSSGYNSTPHSLSYQLSQFKLMAFLLVSVTVTNSKISCYTFKFIWFYRSLRLEHSVSLSLSVDVFTNWISNFSPNHSNLSMWKWMCLAKYRFLTIALNSMKIDFPK